MAIASFTDGSSVSVPAGDRALRLALEERGHSVRQLVWSDSAPEWRDFDAVVIRSCWDYHLRPEEFLDWISRLEALGVPLVNPPPLIRWNLDKRYLAELHSSGIAIPDTLWLEDGESCELTRVCRERGWTSAVVKPLVSASAHRTEVRRTGNATGPAMVQEFVEEIRTAGEWSLMYLGGTFSHAVRKLPAADDFRVQSQFGGTSTPTVPPLEVQAFAAHALARLPSPAALARVDVVVGATGRPALMELEVIEPELFLDGPAAGQAADAVLQALGAEPIGG